MFAPRYFAERYFAGRYFAHGELSEPPTPPVTVYTKRQVSRARGYLFPDPPENWTESSQTTWRRMIQILETSDFFGYPPRNPLRFVVAGAVSAPVTLDVNNPSVTVLNNVFSKLLLAFERTNFLDIRQTL